LKPKISIPLGALFLSGFGALLLEVAWTRLAVLVFGTTTAAATVVLGTFMGGLAAGNGIIGRLLPRVRKPYVAYAVIEMATACVATVIAWLTYRWGASPDIPAYFVVVGLLMPTTLMGMTLPLMISGLSSSGMVEKEAASWGYGINTVGGALGALGAAFLFLPRLGVFGSQWCAVFLLLIAAAISLVYRKVEAQPSTSISSNEKTGHRRESISILGLAFWCGASALALEIVWTRLLALILGPSVYALGIVLFVFLLGIAAGALLCTSVLKKFDAKEVLPMVFLLLGFSVAWSGALFGILPYLFVWLVAWIQPQVENLHFIELFLCVITIVPPALLHGLLLPLLISGYPTTEVQGRSAAWVLSCNTLGAISGAAMTGLILVPYVGLLPVLLTALVFDVLLGIYLLFQTSVLGTSGVRKGLVVTCMLFLTIFGWNARTLWDRSVLASGVYKYAIGDVLAGGQAKIEVGEILFYEEGISSTVAVIKTADDVILSIDGKADASAKGDRSTQVLLAALPLSLAAKTDRTLVIGFASGVTAGVATLFPNSHVTAVEIEPAVYEASRFFLEVNHGPMDLTRHRRIVGDARHYLATNDEQYDVITSEPSNPWMSGVAPLFTKEFFGLARTRIRPGGVMCQWLPIYGMSENLVASVIRTFNEVFPQIMIFESVEGFDLLLIGTDNELTLDPQKMESRWRNRELQKELAGMEIESGLDLVARFLMGREGAKKFAHGAVINTDDNGYIEFGAPRSLHLKTAGRNDARLSQSSEGLLPYLSSHLVTSTNARVALANRLRWRGETRLARMMEP